MASPRALSDIEKPRLVLCEGPQDRAFLAALHVDRRLPEAQITCPGNHNLPSGKDGFGRFLEAIQGWSSFPALQQLIVVTDSDDDPEAAFAAVAAQIDAAKAYPVPEAPHAPMPGPPSVMVVMIPWHDRRGALETLCFEAAARGRQADAACVEALARCTGADAWSEQKLAKMRLRCLVAATHRHAPDIGLGNVWTQAPTLVPVADPAFDRIAEVFRQF